MSANQFVLTRPEGQLKLEQNELGDIRVLGKNPRNIEGHLIGRRSREAIFLSQQLSVDSGVCHALAAVMAWEQAGKMPVSHNGRVLRDLLFSLSMLHAHLRHFYFQLLPDYVPFSEMENYRGNMPQLRSIGNGILKKGTDSWMKRSTRHPFPPSQMQTFSENKYQSIPVLSVIQRMMAIIGGKFPLVMSIAPGGISRPINESVILKLEALLREIGWFLLKSPFEDAITLLKGFPELKSQGKGKSEFVSAGSIGDEEGPDASMFPNGVYQNSTLSLLQPLFSESIDRAFFRIPVKSKLNQGVVEPSLKKADAYSWIKSPRYQGKMMETGAFSRLLVTQLTGARSFVAPVISDFEELIGGPLVEANTISGRILARMGEIAPLARRCHDLIIALLPGQPVIQKGVNYQEVTGEGVARIESPAGMVSHRVTLDNGRITSYDIVTASAWNGASRSESGEKGPLETALNANSLDLGKPKGQLTASRIVQSYFFSTSDAVH